MLTEKATTGYLAAILQEKNVPEKFVPVLSAYFPDLITTPTLDAWKL